MAVQRVRCLARSNVVPCRLFATPTALYKVRVSTHQRLQLLKRIPSTATCKRKRHALPLAASPTSAHTYHAYAYLHARLPFIAISLYG